MKHNWKRRFLALAHTVSGWSKDPSTKVGAVIVRPDRTIVSVGYNGFPRGVNDTPDRYERRDVKYKMVVHAEANAILSSKECNDSNVLFCTLAPCNECMKLIIQSGIKHVIYDNHLPKHMKESENWNEAFQLSVKMALEAGVKLEGI